MSLCREVFPREHLSTERIVQHTVLLWRSSHLIPDRISWSERSLGTSPTQVRDDPSSTLEGLEEDDKITAVRETQEQNSHSLSQPVPSRYGLRENALTFNIIITYCSGTIYINYIGNLTLFIFGFSQQNYPI